MARSIDVNIKHLAMVLQAGGRARGTSFVEVYQNCNVFNDGAFDYATDRDTKADTTLELEHGKPLIFGKNRDKGIRLNGMEPEDRRAGQGHHRRRPAVPRREGARAEPGLPAEPHAHPEFPEPIGVFRAVDRPRYDEELNKQIAQARKAKGEGDLQALFNAGETWVID